MPITGNGLSNLSNQTAINYFDNSQYSLTTEQLNVLKILTSPMSAKEIYNLSEYKNKGNINSYRVSVINVLLEKGLIQRTIPDKPRSSNQKYYRNITQ